MKNSLVSIVVPVYKEDLNEFEQISWLRCKEVFKDFDIIIVHPKGLKLDAYSNADYYVQFPDKYFKSTKTYNVLMCSPLFYKEFLSHEYLLIYQLDAYVFENNLLEWCSKGYSYIGAPWIDSAWIKVMKQRISFFDKLIYPVGNGGLSLRKVRQHYRWAHLYLVVKYFWRQGLNEDVFWTSFINRIIPTYKVPDVKTALEFAFEEHPSKCYELNGNKLPFGCHAWEKFETDFWMQFISKK
jgi:hypothetical protein